MEASKTTTKAEPKFATTGYRRDPYSMQAVKLTVANDSHFTVANYAFVAAAGCIGCALQDVAGATVIRRTAVASTEPVCDKVEGDYVDLFIGGLPYFFDMGIMVQMFRDATGAPILAIETIPGKDGAMPTSCRLRVLAQDKELFTSFDKRAIVVGAGMLVVPTTSVPKFEAAIDERNRILAGRRSALGIDSKRAALRPLVVQLRDVAPAVMLCAPSKKGSRAQRK